MGIKFSDQLSAEDVQYKKKFLELAPLVDLGIPTSLHPIPEKEQDAFMAGFTFQVDSDPRYRGEIVLFADGTSTMLVGYDGHASPKPAEAKFFFEAADSPLRWVSQNDLSGPGISFRLFSSYKEAYGQLATFYLWVFHRRISNKLPGDLVPVSDETIPIVDSDMVIKLERYLQPIPIP